MATRLPSIRRPADTSNQSRPVSSIEEYASNVNHTDAIADAESSKKAKRRSLLPQFSRRNGADDRVEEDIREEDEDGGSRTPSEGTRASEESFSRRGIDEDRKAMPPPSRLSRPASMIPPRGASQSARTKTNAVSVLQKAWDAEEDTTEDAEAARAQSLAALTGGTSATPSKMAMPGSDLSRTSSTRLPQSPRGAGPAIPSRTTSSRTNKPHSRTISTTSGNTASTSIAEKRSSTGKAIPPSQADTTSDSKRRTSPPRSSVMSRPRPTSQMPPQQTSPPRISGQARARPTSQILAPPARPTFTTYQQHYSPAKTSLPKPPVPASKAVRPTSTVEEGSELSADVAKQQIELLQLSLLHQAASKCMQEYTASAKRKLNKMHIELRKDYESVRTTELVQQRTDNLAALESWCRDPTMLVENLQILALVYSDLTALIIEDSRHGDVVGLFELWLNEADSPDLGAMVQPLPDDWKTAHASQALKLRSIQRNLRVLPPPSEADDGTSGLAVVLKSCKLLVDEMLEELEIMVKVEKEVLAREKVHLEESVKALVLEDVGMQAWVPAWQTALELRQRRGNDGEAISNRLLKCSEERPVCAQCLKANRECLPASGVTFRHQQNPSMNGGSERDEGSLKNFYGYRETFQKETTWVEIPKDLTFVHTNNPYEDEEEGHYFEEGDTTFMTDVGGPSTEIASGSNDYDMARQLAQAAYPSYATQGLEALSAVASRDQYSYAVPPTTMGQHDLTTSPQQASTSPISAQVQANRTLDYILNPSNASVMSSSSNNIDPRLHTDTAELTNVISNEERDHTLEHVRTTSYSSSHGRPSLRGKGTNHPHDRRAAIESPELAFLLRDFSERCGSWMDLFDLNLFFSTDIPVLAVRCPLLLYSCAAVAAKITARVDGRRPTFGGQIEYLRRSKLESWPGPPMGAADWSHRAREYYDLAVSLLRQALAGATRPSTASLPEHASPGTIHAAQDKLLPTTDSDELIAATAILCVYEFLDASTPEWSRHLDGAKSLFDIANDSMVDLTLPPSPHVPRTPVSHVSSTFEPSRRSLGSGRRAVFWCFARQDMLSAFINNTHTRLDTFDLDLWRSAGLKITHKGYVCPSNPQHPDYDKQNAMSDDMISNALVWLTAKLVNFIAAGDGVPNDISPLGLGMRQRELLDYWEKLDAQLLAWHEGLPESFHPTAISRPQVELSIEEKWYPRPMCASTAQWWHFARIQLLHNKPHITTATPSSHGRVGFSVGVPGTSLHVRHASYVSILQQSREHAKQIVAIGLGRSDEGARVHSVQPLWTAGLVLGGSDGEDVNESTWTWRRSVLSQLRGIERDMGWASGYRVESLLELWNLPFGWENNCLQ